MATASVIETLDSSNQTNEFPSKWNLSQTDQELLRLVGPGLNNRKISKILRTSESAVKNRLKYAVKKTGPSTSRVDLVVWYTREFRDNAIEILREHNPKLHGFISNAPQKSVPLTQREMDVFCLNATGQEMRDTANDLGVTEGTVKMTLRRAYEKTGCCHSRVELAVLFVLARERFTIMEDGPRSGRLRKSQQQSTGRLFLISPEA